MSDTNLTAVLCPGQGSHEPGMRDDVVRARPDLLELACELVGDDPFERIADGTAFAQPAIYAASLAGWETLGSPTADWVAGHSLGELAALAIAGAIHPHDGLRLAARRGELMQAAADANGGGMLALLGDADAARRLARDHGLTPANENSPEQLVVAGRDEALAAARKAARPAGLRAVRLPVRGAFHSADMEAAQGGFAAALAEVPFAAPGTPVISCASAREFRDPRRELVAALTAPVRWRDTLLALSRTGVTRWVETGPGDVLTKLVERNGLGSEVAAHA